MTRFARWPFLVLLLLGALLLREGAREGGPILSFESAWFDFMASHRTQSRVTRGPASVTVVEINDAVLAGRNKWPLPAMDYALFLQALEEFRPAVVGIEPVLSWPRAQGEAERMLANRALQFPKLVFGVRMSGLRINEQDDAAAALPDELTDVKGDPRRLQNYDDVVARPTKDLQALGLLGPISDTGLNPPRIPLVVRYRGKIIPTFTLQAALLWLKVTPGEIKVRLGSRIQVADRLRIPIDEAGCLLVDTFAPARVGRLGLDDLLLLAEQGTKSTQNERLNLEAPASGGITLLGRTDGSIVASGGSAHNEARAPIDWVAAALSTIQRADFIRRMPAWGEWLLVLGLVMVGAWLQTRLRLGAMLLAAAGVVLYAVIAWILYDRWRWWLPLAMPCGILLAAALLRLVIPDEDDSLELVPAESAKTPVA